MTEGEAYVRTMTPVRVIEGGDGVKIVFLESARFYVLAQDLPEFDFFIAALRDAVEKGAAVEIGTPSIDSDVIMSVNTGK